MDAVADQKHRVAVVTGGGGGIGSNAALELARRGVVVIAMDPGVSVLGKPLDEPTAAATAKRIEAEGGIARSSTASVTDAKAVQSLFEDVVAEFGSLDVVVNTAGILRFSQLLDASEDDWRSVLEVHLDGYVNVLNAALPIMVEAGYGRIVGFTSGVGLARTSVGGVSYGSAKRAVAALTWQLAGLLPDGISVNALSPIAATRMIREALADHKESPKGLDLSAMPQPEHMAPAAAYLSSEEIGWCSGQVLFSAGPEVSPIVAPRLIETVRSERVDDFGKALGTLFPVVFSPGETTQHTSGGSNPRFGPVFDEQRDPAAAVASPERVGQRGCVIVSDDASLGEAVARAVTGWGLTPLGVGAGKPFDDGARDLPTGFSAASETLARAAQSVEQIDAVVVILSAEPAPSSAEPPSWQHVVSSHERVTDQVVAHGAWVHAAFEQAHISSKPVRIVNLVGATTPAGRSTAQAVAQTARSANDTSSDSPFYAYSIALEGTRRGDDEPVAQFVGRLTGADDALLLAGSELVAGPGWIGQRSHPAPAATLSFGQGTVPTWVDENLRQIFPARS
jgi:NAD(P)-dependent dehydrogenase (short-subunit alcohol dehydrogenase family)